MPTFREGLVSGLKSSLCGWLADTDANVRGWTEKTFGRQLSNPALSGLSALLCDRPPLPSTPTPPFTGGQCDFFYDIEITRSWDRYNCSGAFVGTVGPVTTTINTQPGPIKYLGITEQEYEACGGTRLSKHRESVENGSDPPNRFSGGPNGANSGEYLDNVQVSFNVTPSSVVPDNCGDPPPGSTPPQTPDGGWPLPPVDITYDNDEGGTTTINIAPVIFAPVVNLDGSIYAPVRIQGNNIDLDLNLRLGGPGGIDIDFGSRQPPGSDTTVDSDPPEQPEDIRVPPPADDDTERRIIGVVVTTTDIDGTPTTELLQSGGNPNIYVPDLGLVSFAVSAGPRGFGWTPDIRVKNAACYIPCPAPQGAVNVEGTPRAGVTWTITKVYGARSEAFTEPV